jgi:GNAT superfamily N-acetyltransferase
LKYLLEERLPTPAEHRAMFEAVGWEPYTDTETALALQNSLYGVVVLRDGAVIAMGRVIGDGGKFYYIQDFAVRPDWQGQGIGRALMDRILAWIKVAAPHEPFVGLFATEVAREFYAHYGFAEHREVLSGMWMVVPREQSVT